MSSEAQRRACRKYYWKNKERKRVYVIRLDRETDADVIQALNNACITDYIKRLVRHDLEERDELRGDAE